MHRPTVQNVDHVVPGLFPHSLLEPRLSRDHRIPSWGFPIPSRSKSPNFSKSYFEGWRKRIFYRCVILSYFLSRIWIFQWCFRKAKKVKFLTQNQDQDQNQLNKVRITIKNIYEQYDHILDQCVMWQIQKVRRSFSDLFWKWLSFLHHSWAGNPSFKVLKWGKDPS